MVPHTPVLRAGITSVGSDAVRCRVDVYITTLPPLKVFRHFPRGKSSFGIPIFNMAAASDTQPVPLWIDNKPHTSDIVFPVINHGNGRTTRAYGATPDIAKDAINSCQVAFESWKNTTPWERRELLLNAAKLLADREVLVKEVLEVRLSLVF